MKTHQTSFSPSVSFCYYPNKNLPKNYKKGFYQLLRSNSGCVPILMNEKLKTEISIFNSDIEALEVTFNKEVKNNKCY